MVLLDALMALPSGSLGPWLYLGAAAVEEVFVISASLSLEVGPGGTSRGILAVLRGVALPHGTHEGILSCPAQAGLVQDVHQRGQPQSHSLESPAGGKVAQGFRT